MTEHITTLNDDTHSTAAGRSAVIIPFHVATDPESSAPDLADLALARLEAFLAEEGPSLSRVFSLLDLTGAEAEVDALHALLREPGDTWHALFSAEMRIARIVEDLAEISPRAEIQRPMRAGEASIVGGSAREPRRCCASCAAASADRIPRRGQRSRRGTGGNEPMYHSDRTSRESANSGQWLTLDCPRLKDFLLWPPPTQPISGSEGAVPLEVLGITEVAHQGKSTSIRPLGLSPHRINEKAPVHD